MARRDPGYSGLEQMQVSERDAIIQAAATWVGNASALLDRDYQTNLVGYGFINVIFKHPLLISRIALQGILDTVTVTATQITGAILPIVIGVVNANGWDSGPIAPPLMCTQVTITTPNPTTLDEAVIMTTLATQGVVNVNVDNTPAEPFFTQMQQQIVLEECEISVDGDDWDANSPDNAMDKDLTTSKATTGPGTMTIALTHPIMIGRVCIAGQLDDADITVTKVDGTTQVLGAHIVCADGWDSTNFVPIVITQLDITIAVSADIDEVVILKVIEVKGDLSLNWENTPAEPLHVDAQQVVTIEEVDLVRSTVAGAVVTGGIADIFDADQNTGIEYDGAGPQLVVTIELKNIMLLSRIAMVKVIGGDDMHQPLMEVRTVDGTWVVVLDYSDDEEMYPGVDSGNFKADVQKLGPNRAYYPHSPMECTAVRISLQTGFPGSISEVLIHKTIETKSYAYNEPREPLHVQAVQQVCIDEVDTGTSALYPPDGYNNLAVERLFNKQVGVGTIQYTHDDANPGFVEIMFRHPILISRIAATGLYPAGTMLDVLLINGSGYRVFTQADPILTGIDSNNFRPQMASGIIIRLPDDADATLDEVVILKVIETKPSNDPAHPLQVEAEQQVVLDEVTISAAGDSVVGDPNNIMDKDLGTSCVVTNGIIMVPFKQIKMISRLAFKGTCEELKVSVLPTDSATPIVLKEHLEVITGGMGWDSGNFPPIMAIGVVLDCTGGAMEINELTILKSIEVKPMNDAAHPLQVQAEQQIDIDEVDIVATTFVPSVNFDPLDIRNVFLKQVGIGFIQYTHDDVNPSTITIMFKHPIMVARISCVGVFPALTSVGVLLVSGLGVSVYVLTAPTTHGFDSGNFNPQMVSGISITLPPTDDATLDEVVINKVIEMKGEISLDAANTPDKPFFVEAPQIVTIEEIDTDESVLVGAAAGATLESLFDRNHATGAAFTGSLGDGVTIVLKAPLLLARVAVQSLALGMRQDVNILVTDVMGNLHVVWDGYSFPVSPLTDGLDSGNFTQQPFTGAEGPPASPIVATEILIQTQHDGAAFDISEIVLFKAIETKAFAYNEPREPLYVEDDQHISEQEVWWQNVIVSGGLGDQPRTLFDKDPTTHFRLGDTGAIGIPFAVPHLISRFVIDGNGTGVTVLLIRPDGTTRTLLNNEDIVDGWDSGNFAPTMVKVVYIYTAADTGALDAYTLAIFKALETKDSHTQENPLQVEAEQQVVLDEVELSIDPFVAGDLTPIMDKNRDTGVTIPHDHTLNVSFKAPKLIDRVAVTGVGADLTITVTAVDGTVITLLDEGDFTDGWDSGNFTPVMVTDVDLSTVPEGAYSVITELVILKVIETKDGHSQSQPLQVEAEQQTVLDELDLVESNSHSSNIGTFTDIRPTIDKNLNTTVTSGDGAWQVVHVFNSPKLISRVCVVGSNMKAVAVFYTDLNGAVVVLVPETAGPVLSLDSGNFTPVMATGYAVVGTAPNADPAIINELICLKTIETKSFVANTDSYPGKVQMMQQVARNDLSAINITGVVTDAEKSFDKDLTTEAVYPAGAASITYVFKHPILIGRVALDGGTVGLIDIEVVVSDIAHVNRTVIPATGTGPLAGIDSGNFAPIMAESVSVNQLVTGGGTTLAETTILKVIETKTYAPPSTPVHVQALQQVVLDEVVVTSGGANPFVFPEKTIDKDIGTASASPGPGIGTLVYTFKFPVLIARVSAVGAIPALSTITVTDSLGVAAVMPSTRTATGLDTGNFPPVMASIVTITVPSAATVSSTVILKAIETKAYVANSPNYPAIVQMPQQISRGDLSSIGITGVVTNAENSFDKNRATEATMPAGVCSIIYNFRSPILINRIALDGGSVGFSHVTVTVTDVANNIVSIIPDTGTGPTPGIDSMNFAPIMAKTVTVAATAAGAGGTLAETIIQKVIEVKSLAEVRQASLMEFYGQKVFFDPFVANAVQYYYLLLRRALETDADNDPTASLDQTTVTITSSEAPISRIKQQFHVPTDDIRKARHHATAMATVDLGTNARCTAILFCLYRRNIVTGVLTPLSAVKTVTVNADGATSRAVRCIMQDIASATIPIGEVLVLEIDVWGRQVSSSATPAPITLIHNRGLGDCKLDIELITQATEEVQ